MRKAIIATFLVMGLAALAPSPAVAAEPVRKCGNYDLERWTYGQVYGAGIFNVKARVVRCRTARRVAIRSLHRARPDAGVWRWRVWTCRLLAEGYEFYDVRCRARRGRMVRYQTGA